MTGVETVKSKTKYWESLVSYAPLPSPLSGKPVSRFSPARSTPISLAPAAPLYSLTFGGTVSLTAFVSAVSLANEFSSRACSFR